MNAQTLPSLLILVSALGTGLMSGVYFTFSTFVMKALKVIPSDAGMLSMQSINDVILRSLFMPLFFGTTLLSLGLSVWGITRFAYPQAQLLVAAGAIYVVGMFICTVAFNVPLNESLARADATSLQAHSIWTNYVSSWTSWNHVRTIASLVASGLYVAALLFGGSLRLG